MKGLFDTDGSIYFEKRKNKTYPRIDIKTTSERLCKKITKKMNKSGIRTTYYEYIRKEVNWKNLFSIIVRGQEPIRKWKKNIGSNNPKHIIKLKRV